MMRQNEYVANFVTSDNPTILADRPLSYTSVKYFPRYSCWLACVKLNVFLIIP